MEAYNENSSGCVTAVLTFLDAWTRQLNSQGYVSGVYSSAASGITDLQTTTTVANHALAEPQAIWFALWDNAVNLTGAPYMSTAVWPTASRSKQYAGAKVVSVGGYSIDIDSDLVDSAVVRGMRAGHPNAPDEFSSLSSPSAPKLGASGQRFRPAAAPVPESPRGSRPSHPPTASRMETSDGPAQ